jgi:hypothetical protein
MTTAIENIGSGLSRPVEMLATVFAYQQQPQYQQQWLPQPTQHNNFQFSKGNGYTQRPTQNNINPHVPENK